MIEALNWYSYVSNNPVKYVDPTGMANWDTVASGGLKVATGALKMVAGAGAIVGTGGAAALTGGATTPASVAGMVIGGTLVVDGFVKANIGLAEIIAGLADTTGMTDDMDIPDTMSEMLGMGGDLVSEAVTGKESGILQKVGKWIGSLPVNALDLLLNPTPLGNESPSEMGNNPGPYQEPMIPHNPPDE